MTDMEVVEAEADTDVNVEVMRGPVADSSHLSFLPDSTSV